MNRDQISNRIKEIENELSNLRTEFAKPGGIVDFEVGDVFGYGGGVGLRVVILNVDSYLNKYKFANRNNNALDIWCDFGKEGGTKAEVLEKLNYQKAKFIKNISADLNNLVNN